MKRTLKDLIERTEEWPPVAQAEAVALLEAISGYVSLGESSQDDR
jgi:hypothetical protein